MKVFAFGEHAGHPYLAMEFLPGGTLADRVTAGGPLPAREATEHVAKLAEAVAHAHSRGVVHRDIKPANVLLTADGEPRLADFGLAKVGRSDLTGTGQALGTPSYMSPEQAAGKTHEVGTPADVYALGAVLYDLLTGRPPFRGNSVAVTLQKVMSADPERPRKLIASIPRDLETICLKCLDKEPGKRFATAQSLADDLTRFLRGEPISVRPTGPLERGYKWVRRNKVVAGAVAAVSLALVAGAGASFAFGQHALEKERAAEEATEQAEREKRDAFAARNELKDKNDELVRSQERINRTLAKSILGPLTDYGPSNPLSGSEQEVLGELADLRRTEVPIAFLDEAVRTPLTRAKLATRADYALHAAVGLDPARRAAAERLLLARAERQEDTLEERTEFAVVLLRSGLASPDARRAAARVLADAIVASTSQERRWVLAEDLPDEADAKDRSWVAQVLSSGVVNETNPSARGSLAVALARVTARMSQAEAAELCAPAARALVGALRAETESVYRAELASGVSALADRLPRDLARTESAEAVSAVAAALAKESDAQPRGQLTAVLVKLAVQMPSAQNGRALCTAIGTEPKGWARAELARGVIAVTGGVPAAEARALTALALEAVRAARAGETEKDFSWELAKAQADLTARLDPVESLGRFAELLRSEPNVDLRSEPAERLAQVAPLAPNEAVPHLLAGLSPERLAKEKYANVSISLAGALTTIAPHVERARHSQAATAAARALVEALEKEGERRDTFGIALSGVTAFMEPGEAAAVLIRALTNGPPNARRHLVPGLSAVAERLPPAEAVRLLLPILAAEADGDAMRSLSRALFDTSLRLPPREGARLRADVARHLADAPDAETQADALWALARIYAALAAQVERPEAVRLCTPAARRVAELLPKEAEPRSRWTLAHALVELLPALDPAEAAVLCSKAMPDLAAIYTKGSDQHTLATRADVLSALAARMSPGEATRLCTPVAESLTAALTKLGDNEWSSAEQAKALAGLLPLLAPDDSARLRATAFQKLSDAICTRPVNSRWELERGLLELVAPREGGATVRIASASAVATFVAPHNLVPSLALLHPVLQSPLRVAPAPALVELLKHPFCVGEARRVVLDALEFTYSRKFKDQWEFVEYAQKHQPQLDLLTPPKRSQP